MNRDLLKIRAGGVLTREFEQRVLDGDHMAMRALVVQAQGVNTLDLETKQWELNAKADGTGGTRLTFTGYASVVEHQFTMGDWLGDYNVILRQGCFAKTLSESPDVIFCVNHDWDAVPMARTAKAGTLRLSADSTGLYNEADLDVTRSDVYQVQSAMEAGELDAQSFAFMVTRQEWSPDFEQRDILEVDINGGDTSVVTFPANPATTGTVGLHKRQAHALIRTNVPALLAQKARAERHAGKALSAATMESLQAVLDLISAADTGLSSAVPLLSALMGLDEETEAAPTDAETASHEPDLDLERLALIEAEYQYLQSA